MPAGWALAHRLVAVTIGGPWAYQAVECAVIMSSEVAQVNVTLDMNCIIDLEQQGPAAPFIRELVDLHKAGAIKLQVVATQGAERKQDGSFPSTIEDFRNRLAGVGLGDLELVPSIGFYDFNFFLGFSVLAGAKHVDLERKIHHILFPNIQGDFKACCGDPPDPDKEIRWRNAKCDVVTMWGHIWSRGDVFVTSDRNFHKETKRARLIALGASSILTPQEAVATLRDR